MPRWGLCGSLTSLAILTYSRIFDIKTSNRQRSFVNWVADNPAKRRRTIQKTSSFFLGSIPVGLQTQKGSVFCLSVPLCGRTELSETLRL